MGEILDCCKKCNDRKRKNENEIVFEGSSSKAQKRNQKLNGVKPPQNEIKNLELTHLSSSKTQKEKQKSHENKATNDVEPPQNEIKIPEQSHLSSSKIQKSKQKSPDNETIYDKKPAEDEIINDEEFFYKVDFPISFLNTKKKRPKLLENEIIDDKKPPQNEKVNREEATENKDKNPLEYYDEKIEVNSLKEFLKGDGWRILRRDNYEEKEEKELTIVGIVGNMKKGKTYLMKKIINEGSAKGDLPSTKGINVKFSSQPLVFLDVAGFKFVDNGKEAFNKSYLEVNEIIKERENTSNFITEFLIHKVQVIILVVDEMELIDQITLKKLEAMCDSQSIFVVHNIHSLKTKEGVDDYIRKTFKENSNMQEFNMVRMDDETDKNAKVPVYYSENHMRNSDKKEFQIIHLIYRYDGEDVDENFRKDANYNNTATIEFIQNTIISKTEREKIELVDDYEKYIKEVSGKYFGNFIQPNVDTSDDNAVIIKKDNETEHISTPHYFYRIENETLTIGIECGYKPETIKVNTKIVADKYSITISGKKEVSDPSKNGYTCNSTSIEKGEFSVNIFVKLNDVEIKSDNNGKIKVSKCFKKDGLVLFQYNIKNKISSKDI